MSNSGKGNTGLLVEKKVEIDRTNHIGIVSQSSDGPTIGTHVKGDGHLKLKETGGISFVGDVPQNSKLLETLAATYANKPAENKREQKEERKQTSNGDIAGQSEPQGSRNRKASRDREHQGAKSGQKLSDASGSINVNIVSRTMKFNKRFSFPAGATFGDVMARVVSEEEKDIELQDEKGNALSCDTKLSDSRCAEGGIKVFAVESVVQLCRSK